MNGGRAILPPYTHHETTRVDVLCDTPTRNVGAISKRMISWANRWRVGIYQSMCRAKLLSKRVTHTIQMRWDPNRKSEPEKKVGRRRSTNSKQRKYKTARITTKLKVTKRRRSTSKVKGYKKRFFNQKRLNECTPKEYTPVVNEALFGDAFND